MEYLDIDWEDLRKHKKVLGAVALECNTSLAQRAALAGIKAVIDLLQDDAAKAIGYKTVYGLKDHTVTLRVNVPQSRMLTIIAESQEAAEETVRLDLQENSWASPYYQKEDRDWHPDWSGATNLHVRSSV